MTNYLQAITACFWLLWPISTLATTVTLGQTLGSIPGQAWVSVLVLSLISGAVAVLQRVNKAVKIERAIELTPETDSNFFHLTDLRETLAETQIPDTWLLFVVWHMAGAVLMGTLAFFFLEAADVNDFIEAVAIALSSYGGARLVDKVGDSFAARVIQSVQNDKTP